MADPGTILIVDGNAILHRAYHALPPFTAPDGRLVNAAYGFLTVFFKALVEFKPEAVAVTFDRPEETFRKRLFPAYQAQREEKPDELYAQISIIKGLLSAMDVPIYEAAGYEADDVIGTIVERSSKLQVPTLRSGSRYGVVGTPSSKPHTIVLTGDKDLLQLVGDRVEVVLLRRGMTDTARYNSAAVIERFGFPPERIPDFKALAGDPSDNYPGVPGIGEKTATKLVQSFGGVSEILKNASAENRPPELPEKLAAKIRDHADAMRLGLKLATIVRNVPLAFRSEDCLRRPFDRDAMVQKLRELGFQSLLGRLPENGQQLSLSDETGDTVQTLSNYELLMDAPSIARAISDVRRSDEVSLAIVTAEGNALTDSVSAFGLAFDGRALGIPADVGAATTGQLLGDGSVKKNVHGTKSVIRSLGRISIDFVGLRDDTELLSYLLAPGSRSHDLAHIAFHELGVEFPAPSVDAMADATTSRRAVVERAAREASIVQQLVPILRDKVAEAGLTRVYEEIDRPLIPVLVRMEEAGVRIDVKQLARLGDQMRRELAAADQAIYRHTSHEFNIDSPQQLKVVLFEELGLAVRGLKKTVKGRTLSTAAPELEKLRGSHPIIEKILAHRELAKLLSTYVESLPTLIDPATDRIHTTYHQTVTATGRLSSSNPNLQNIPVSEPWGPAIRSCFIAEDGWQLLSLDYSQFELRIAAALSGDRALTHAFRSRADIHATTAAEIFGVSAEAVTRDQRRIAKAINFGIMYGMGSSALAQTASITRTEAEEYIARYFQTYPELHEWIETTKALARSRGYVETLFGRKRFLPEITSGVPQVRAAAERMAVNMPVQGTQADLLKMAMIQADEWIRSFPSSSYPSCSSSRAQRGISHQGQDIHMVLTVHDELVFEVRDGFVAEAVRALQDILESVHKLPVPIIAEAKVGKNWGEMERVANDEF
ncbi:MAG: DNA polymerase I [Candidatus Uhrbacteria bacterium]